jgi:hypothetical protein
VYHLAIAPAKRLAGGIQLAATKRAMCALPRCGRRTSNYKSVIIIAVIYSIARFAFAGLADASAPKLDSLTVLSSNSLPSQIITTDGKVYKAVKFKSIEPDGLLVEYLPDSGGIGLAKLKFAKLPESLQQQFGYDPLKASVFEHQQSLAAFALSQKLQKEEKTQIAVLNNMSQRPNVARAVAVSSSDPTVTYTYYANAFWGSYSDCQPDYQCHADFDLHAEPSPAGPPFRFHLDAVKISLAMSCHITEPKFPYDYIRIEQEGRRKIYEYFYRFGPQVARRIGESMIGKELTSPETDFEAAKKSALSRAETLVKSRYSLHLGSVARKADQYYEKLIDHGQNSFDRDKAVQEAIAKYGNQMDLQTSIPVGQPRIPSNPGVRPPSSQAVPLSSN